MLLIKRVPPESGVAMEGAEILLKSSCYKHALLTKQEFVQCCNSIYVITDESYSSMLGVIACRRIYASEVDRSIIGRFRPFENIYQIEALHYEKSVPDDKKKELIETCMNDKQEAVVVLKAKCINVIEDEKFLESIGFVLKKVQNNTFYYLRRPKRDENRIFRSIKNIFR